MADILEALKKVLDSAEESLDYNKGLYADMLEEIEDKGLSPNEEARETAEVEKLQERNDETYANLASAYRLRENLVNLRSVNGVKLEYLSRICHEYGLKSLEDGLNKVVNEFAKKCDSTRDELQTILNNKQLQAIPSTEIVDGAEISLEYFKSKLPYTKLPGYASTNDNDYEANVCAKYFKGKDFERVEKSTVQAGKLEVTSMGLADDLNPLSGIAKFVNDASFYEEKMEEFRDRFKAEFDKQEDVSIFDKFSELKTKAVKLMEKFNKENNDLLIKIEILKDAQKALKEEAQLEGLEQAQKLKKMQDELELQRQDAINKFVKRHGRKIDKLMGELSENKDNIKSLNDVAEHYNNQIKELSKRIPAKTVIEQTEKQQKQEEKSEGKEEIEQKNKNDDRERA